MLDVDSTASFLVRRGLIGTDCIIDGTLKVRCEARRNRNVRVERSQGRGFLIKQPDDPGHGGDVTLRNEAAFHQVCRQHPNSEELAQFIPRLIDYEPEVTRLVFELIPDAQPFQSMLASTVGRAHAVAAAHELGKSLAKLHRCFRAETVQLDKRLAELHNRLPWATGLHRPGLETLALMSAANYRTVAILQSQEGLAANLDRLREEWRPETVIHGDVKFDNILVHNDHAPAPVPSVRTWIVDWEMAQIGDPAWDVAGALQEFLVVWVQSMPMTQELTSEERSARAEVPLADLRETIRALWEGYRVTADLRHHDGHNFLERSVKYSAARLIQTAYEMLFTAHQLNGPPVLLLQVAAHILAEPRSAQVQLYGIPWRDSLR